MFHIFYVFDPYIILKNVIFQKNLEFGKFETDPFSGDSATHVYQETRKNGKFRLELFHELDG